MAFALVVMLACLIVRELTQCWQSLDLTVEEAIKELSSLCMDEVTIKEETTIHQIPSHGQSRHCRPIQKKRVIDLCVGDFIRHRGRSYIIDGIEAYREAWVEQLSGKLVTEGYVVRGS